MSKAGCILPITIFRQQTGSIHGVVKLVKMSVCNDVGGSKVATLLIAAPNSVDFITLVLNMDAKNISYLENAADIVPNRHWVLISI